MWPLKSSRIMTEVVTNGVNEQTAKNLQGMGRIDSEVYK